MKNRLVSKEYAQPKGSKKHKLSKKVKKPLKLGFLSRMASGKKAKNKKFKMNNPGISVAVTRDDTPILK